MPISEARVKHIRKLQRMYAQQENIDGINSANQPSATPSSEKKEPSLKEPTSGKLEDKNITNNEEWQNIPYHTQDQEINLLFKQLSQIKTLNIEIDQSTGQQTVLTLNASHQKESANDGIKPSLLIHKLREIDHLKKENEEQKVKFEELEQQKNQLCSEIDHLKKENEEQKVKFEELEQQKKELTLQINHLTYEVKICGFASITSDLTQCAYLSLEKTEANEISHNNGKSLGNKLKIKNYQSTLDAFPYLVKELIINILNKDSELKNTHPQTFQKAISDTKECFYPVIEKMPLQIAKEFHHIIDNNSTRLIYYCELYHSNPYDSELALCSPEILSILSKTVDDLHNLTTYSEDYL